MAPADAGAIFFDAKLFRIKFNDIQQDLGGLVHPLDGGAFADAVEVETAGAEVGAGQTLPAQDSAVGAAADGISSGVRPAFSMALRAVSTRWKWGLIFSSILR